ncbi:MAG: hypothetical protein AAGJ93_11365 [Bacteroidota bacterium]
MSSITIRLPLHGLRSAFVNWCYRSTHPIYGQLTRRGKPAWQLNVSEFKRMPPASLGAALGNFLQSNQLQLMPGFENHDIFHILLDYDTSAPQEVALQWCLLGNGKRSAYAILTALIGFFIFPEHWGLLRSAYKRGQRMRSFHHWYFEYLLREDLAKLQAFLNYQKTKNYAAQH